MIFNDRMFEPYEGDEMGLAQDIAPNQTRPTLLLANEVQILGAYTLMREIEGTHNNIVRLLDAVLEAGHTEYIVRDEASRQINARVRQAALGAVLEYDPLGHGRAFPLDLVRLAQGLTADDDEATSSSLYDFITTQPDADPNRYDFAVARHHAALEQDIHL
jgi:hypothetical protein